MIKIDSLTYNSGAFINGILNRTATRSFMPKGLFMSYIDGKNISLFTSATDSVTGSSIAFSQEESYLATIGEYCERYSASVLNENATRNASYSELSSAGINALHPKKLSLYSKKQYKSKDLRIAPLEVDDVILWAEGFDYLKEEPIWVPAFLAYLGLASHTAKKRYLMSTSTGLASHNSIENAMLSGLLENMERAAFSYFWYNQENIAFKKYSKETILSKYKSDSTIQQLFINNKVSYNVYDLQEYCFVECIVVIMYFEFKGKTFQTIGSAARWTKSEALIKAMLEAYQGIDYAIYLAEENNVAQLAEDKHDLKFNWVNSFEKHFNFYNEHPEYKKNVPLLVDAMDFTSGYQSEVTESKNRIENLNDKSVLEANLKQIYVVRLTTPDVAAIGYEVVRVITPGLSLLTGVHQYPYFGNLENESRLYTSYPHPFP